MFWVYLTRYVPYVGNVEIHIPRILTYTTDRHFLSPGAAHYGPNNKDHMYLKLSLLLLIVTCMAESDFSSPQKKWNPGTPPPIHLEPCLMLNPSLGRLPEHT